MLGPDSSLGPMIAATILPILGANGSPERAIALASMLALIVGAIMIAAGVAKLGFVADLLSKPTQIGYMNGLALTILIGQLPKLFGFSTDANGLINEASAFVHGLASGEAVGAAVAIGVLSLALILALGRWLPRVPGVLVAVVVAIAAVVGVQPRRPRRLAGRDAAEGIPAAHGAEPGLGPAAAGRRRARDRARRAHRHDLDRVGVRRPHRAGGRRQRRDDRDRRRERRRRVLPGLPGQHQRVAHRGRRAGRRQDAAHRRRRRGADRADARARSGAAEEPPQPDARRGRDRRVAVAGRRARDRPAVASASRRVPALDHGVPRRRAARRAGGHRGRRRALDPQRLPAGLVALPDHARARRRDARAARPPAAPRAPRSSPAS